VRWDAGDRRQRVARLQGHLRPDAARYVRILRRRFSQRLAPYLPIRFRPGRAVVKSSPRARDRLVPVDTTAASAHTTGNANRQNGRYVIKSRTERRTPRPAARTARAV